MPDIKNEEPQTTNPDQKQTDNTKETDTSHLASKSELDALREQLTKVRSQEREKVRADLEAVKQAKEELAQELAAVKSDLQRTVRLPDPEPEPKVTVDSVHTSLSESQAEIAALRAELAKRSESEARIKEDLLAETRAIVEASKAEAYKEAELRKANLGPLASLVSGATTDEIKASIDAAKAMKKELAKEAQAEIQKQYEGFVPKAVGIDGAKQLLREQQTHNGTSHNDIKRLRSMSTEQRLKERQARLDKIKQAHGHMFTR